MTDIEIKLIKFLLSSAVYSDNAIMKNLGINEAELVKAYETLEKNGYLESYEAYEARNPKTNCSSNCYSDGDCSACNKCSMNSTFDTSKVKVITAKAIREFEMED